MEAVPKPEKEYQLAKRPEPLKTPYGQKIGLISNCYEIALKNPGIVHTYAVAFNPGVINEEVRRKKKIIGTFEREDKLKFLYPFVFNGTNIFSLKKIDQPQTISGKIENIPYEVKVTWANSFELKNIAAYDKDRNIAIQAKSALNIIVKKLLESFSFIKLNRGGKYVNLRQTNNFGENLQVASGCMAKVTYLNSKLLLNVDMITRVINTTTVAQFLSDLRSNCLNTKDFENKAYRIINTRVVLTKYGDCKTYQIDGIDFNSNPKSEYIDTPYKLKQKYPKLEDKINLVEYYRLAYNIEIQDRASPPLLISNYTIKDPKTHKLQIIEKMERKLIPELCYLTGLEEEMRDDHQLMQELSNYTKMSPKDRINSIRGLINTLTSPTMALRGQNVDNKILQDFGLEIKNASINVCERKLNNQNIILGGSKKSATQSENGLYKLNSHILDPIKLDKWILIYSNQNKDYSQEFVDNLYKSAQTFGISVEFPFEKVVQGKAARNYVEAAFSAIEEVKNPQIIVFITERKEYYKEIKQQFIYHDSILTQIVLGSTLRKGKGLMSICSNIALQINAKMNKPIINLKFEDDFPPMMVMGMDIRKSKDKGQYIIGCSSSTDLSLVKYYSQYRSVRPKTEPLSSSFSKFIPESLKRFSKENKNKLPEIIIVYRSGISESQIYDEFFIEADTLYGAVKKFKENYEPKFFFCIVNEKSNGMRFFTKENISENKSNYRGRGAHGEEWSNPPAGTLIYNDLTDTKLFEFYLQPQYVSSGSATPVKFQVLLTNSKVKLEVFANLTNSLCYMYPNWRGAIKIPACLKQSKKMLDLISKVSDFSENFKGDFNESMFYL